MPLFFLWFHKAREGWVQIPVSSPLTCQVLEPTLRKVAHLRVLCEKAPEARLSLQPHFEGSVVFRIPLLCRVGSGWMHLFHTVFKGAKHTQLSLQNQFWWCVVYVGSRRGVPGYIRVLSDGSGVTGSESVVSFPMERILQIHCGFSASIACPVYY